LVLGGITGSLVTRNATDVLWSTFAFAGAAGQTYTFPAAGGTVPLGTGTANYVTKWTGTNTLGNSVIQDDGTNVGINVAPNALRQVNILKTITVDPGSWFNIYSVLTANVEVETALRGIQSTVNVSGPSGGLGTGEARGLFFSVNKTNTGIVDILEGVYGGVANGGTGASASMTALHSSMSSHGAALIGVMRGFYNELMEVHTGTVTDLYSLKLGSSAAVWSGAGAVTNAYGIYIEAVSGAIAQNYSIYTNAGLVHFGDHVDLTNGKVFKINAVQVVGAQGLAVADSIVDLTSVSTQLNLLLARCRTHGLIAP
jgi:hypothetical protein